MCNNENDKNFNQSGDPLPPNLVRDHNDLAASLRAAAERQEEEWWISQEEEMETSKREAAENELTEQKERESKTTPDAKPRKRKVKTR